MTIGDRAKACCECPGIVIAAVVGLLVAVFGATVAVLRILGDREPWPGPPPATGGPRPVEPMVREETPVSAPAPVEEEPAVADPAASETEEIAPVVDESPAEEAPVDEPAVEPLASRPGARARATLRLRPTEGGGWHIEAEPDGVLESFPNKRAGLSAARKIARDRAPSRLVVYYNDGRVQDDYLYD
ncbi:MAG: DUF2188 domain-containing protein [Acidobacteriota bacterium]